MKFKTLAFIAASSAMTLPAFAEGLYDITDTDTLFGTGVSNTASLTYQVTGTGTGTSTTINGTSNTVEFVVDRKVIFSVTDNQTSTDPVVVNAGDNAVTIYTIQNDSNAPISFKLPVPPTGTTYSYVDPTDASNTITVGNGDPAAIIPLAVGNATSPVTVDVTVTLTVPNDAESGDKIFTPLNITAVEPADSVLIDNGKDASGVTAGKQIVATKSSEAWDEDVIQTITIGDLLNADGVSVELNNTQEFVVAASDIDLVKSVAILSDPVNGTTKPKAIPGAVVEYTLTIYNLGAVAASGITLTDTVPSVFNVADAYTELFYDDTGSAIDSNDIAVSGNAITISNISVAADTDTSDSTVDADGNIEYKTTDGKTIIKFTVKLP